MLYRLMYFGQVTHVENGRLLYAYFYMAINTDTVNHKPIKKWTDNIYEHCEYDNTLSFSSRFGRGKMENCL